MNYQQNQQKSHHLGRMNVAPHYARREFVEQYEPPYPYEDRKFMEQTDRRPDAIVRNSRPGYREIIYPPMDYNNVGYYGEQYESLGQMTDETYHPYYSNNQVYSDETMQDSPFDYFQKPAQPTYMYEPYQQYSEPGPAPQQGNMQGGGDNRFLAHFQNDNGQYDFDKIFSTAGQFIGIVRQVTPMVGQLGTFIKAFRG